MSIHRSSLGLLSALLTLVGCLLVALRAAADPPGAAATVTRSAEPRPAASTLPPQRTSLQAAYARLPYSFETNGGQADPTVRFIARGPGYKLFLTATEAVLALRSGEPSGTDRNPGARPRATARPSAPKVLRMRLVGANPQPLVSGEGPLSGKVNYFRGKNPQAWRTGLSTYARVRYGEVYPGTDLVYYGTRGQLEYDLILAPGADPRAIAIAFEGAESLRIDAQGNLVLDMGAGEVVQHRPRVYQEIAGERRPVAARYLLADKGRVGLEIDDYDTGRALTIDPVLVYSSYLGGSGYDGATGLVTDRAGDIYLAGWTGSDDFPVSSGALQPSREGEVAGYYDAFVVKLAGMDLAPIYSTYLGGSGDDWSAYIAADETGSLYACGSTSSADFPTVNALQPNKGGTGDFQDAYVAKLDATGSALVYSTYLGGAGADWCSSIAVGKGDHAYLTGGTTSGDFPTTAQAFQPRPPRLASPDSFRDNAFVTKLAPDGRALVYSTYLGGGGHDDGRGIAVDKRGNAYVAGGTQSFDFPTTARAFQRFHGGEPPGPFRVPQSDAYVAKLGSDGSSLVYSTYLGGSESDRADALALDEYGRVYLGGNTFSTDFPISDGALQRLRGGSSDGFVAKLDSSGSGLVFATYLGGAFDETVAGIALDRAGAVYVTGSTGSSDFPTTADAFQPVGGSSEFFVSPDGYVSGLDRHGSTLLYSTYLGDADNTALSTGIGIAVDLRNNLYVIGTTSSPDMQTTESAAQPELAGLYDGFFVKLAVGK